MPSGGIAENHVGGFPITMITISQYPCCSSQPLMTVPIVLFNGWGMNDSVWQSVIPALQKMTDVLVTDMTYIDNVEHLCQNIHKRLPTQSIFLGWSLGGMLATRIAAKYPTSVNALITLASNVQFVANRSWVSAMPEKRFSAFYQSFLQDAEKTRRRFLHLIVQGDEHRHDQQHWLRTRHMMDVANDYHHWCSGLHLLRDLDNRQAICDIQCPALHVFGEYDQLVPVETIQAMRNLNASSHYHTIKNAGHWLHSPHERVAMVIETFLHHSVPVKSDG